MMTTPSSKPEPTTQEDEDVQNHDDYADHEYVIGGEDCI